MYKNLIQNSSKRCQKHKVFLQQSSTLESPLAWPLSAVLLDYPESLQQLPKITILLFTDEGTEAHGLHGFCTKA